MKVIIQLQGGYEIWAVQIHRHGVCNESLQQKTCHDVTTISVN